jgi:hypothetical protein
MPISQTFDVNPLTLQEALYRGGYGIAEAQQFERDRSFNEGTRQFDVKTALEQEAMLMQERLRQEALAQQAMEADYRFQLGAGQLGLDQQRTDLYGQQLEAQQAQDEGVTQRAMLSQMGQTVRDREKRNFDVAISQQDAITDARAKNLIDDQQFAEAAQVWQERHGIPWDFPQQMAAQQDEANAQAEEQMFMDSIQSEYFPGETVVPKSMIPMLRQMQPTERFDRIHKAKQENRARYQAQQEEQRIAKEQAAEDANTLRDDVREESKIDISRRAAEQDRADAAEKAKQDRADAAAKAKFDRQALKWKAHFAAWSKKMADPLMSGKAGDEPKFEDFAEPDLKPGESIFTNPYGISFIKHADGSYSPL